MESNIFAYVAAGVSVASTVSSWLVHAVSFKYKIIMLSSEIQQLKVNDIARIEERLGEHIMQDVDERKRLGRSLRRIDRTLVRVCVQNGIVFPDEQEGG